jgi:hypothetical protein
MYTTRLIAAVASNHWSADALWVVSEKGGKANN